HALPSARGVDRFSPAAHNFLRARAGGRGRLRPGSETGRGREKNAEEQDRAPHHRYGCLVYLPACKMALPLSRSAGTETCSWMISHLPLILRYTSVTRTTRSMFSPFFCLPVTCSTMRL